MCRLSPGRGRASGRALATGRFGRRACAGLAGGRGTAVAQMTHDQAARALSLGRLRSPPPPGLDHRSGPVRRWQCLKTGAPWQLDATPHRWFPGDKRHYPLLDLLDDCSRVCTGATIYHSEDLLAGLDFLPTAFMEHGLPMPPHGGPGKNSRMSCAPHPAAPGGLMSGVSAPTSQSVPMAASRSAWNACEQHARQARKSSIVSTPMGMSPSSQRNPPPKKSPSILLAIRAH